VEEKSIAHMAKELETQIEKARTLTPEDRRVLEDLRRDIKDLLERSEEPAQSNRAVIDRLRDASGRFESSHPGLAAVLTEAIDLLTKLGI